MEEIEIHDDRENLPKDLIPSALKIDVLDSDD
jgi:hypothetical protein